MTTIGTFVSTVKQYQCTHKGGPQRSIVYLEFILKGLYIHLVHVNTSFS